MARKRRDQKRNIAFELYCNTGMTQEQIAESVGVTAKTVGEWKRKYNWEEIKGAETVTSRKITSNLYRLAYKITEELVEEGKEPSAKQIDQLAKIAKSIEQLSDHRVTVSQAINVFKEFTTWLFTRDQELAKKINKHQQVYINELINAEL